MINRLVHLGVYTVAHVCGAVYKERCKLCQKLEIAQFFIAFFNSSSLRQICNFCVVIKSDLTKATQRFSAPDREESYLLFWSVTAIITLLKLSEISRSKSISIDL